MDSKGNSTEYNDTKEIAAQVVLYNKQHFNQAQDTPMAFHGTKDNISKKYHKYPEKVQDLMKQFTKSMGQEAENVISPFVEEKDWIRKIRKSSERTTTSPSGMHLGHYKSMISPHNWLYNTNSKIKNKYNVRQREMMKFQISLVNPALKSGYALERWKNVHSLLLSKDNWNVYMHRTRNINIYEAYQKLILKIKWAQAMAQAEDQNSLSNVQYGSRKQKTAYEPVLMEMLQHEITRLTMQIYNQVNFDAQSCYDRIIPNIAIRIRKKYGVHPKVLNVFQNTLQDSKHYIKIGLQTTSAYYKTSQNN
jgi:hypothetical protein